MTLKEKKDAIFERAKNGVKQIPTHTIVSEYVELKKDGIHYKGFCPFHSSKTMNSFRVTDSKNYYKCFGCDAGGTGVGFVADYKGISYHDALFYVAQEYGIISSEEYDLMMGKKAVTQKPREKKSFKKIDIAQEKQKANPCSIKIKNDVYDFMKEFFGLSEEHRNHLKNVRHLSDEAIEKDFFSLVEEKKEAFIKALKIKFSYSVEELMNVPGFFYEKEHSCLRMANYEGIGILIRGLDGYIKAVQVRKDKDEPDKPRYVWFASNFVFKYPQFYKGGNGTGSPVDLLYPAVMKKKYAVGICEGKFKGEILAQQLFDLHEQLQKATETAKELKEEIKKASLPIAKASHGARTAFIPYGKTGDYVQVSLCGGTPRKASLVDVDKVEEKFPDLYNRYLEEKFNATLFIKENPQLLEEVKKDDLTYSESSSDGIKMVSKAYVSKIVGKENMNDK